LSIGILFAATNGFNFSNSTAATSAGGSTITINPVADDIGVTEAVAKKVVPSIVNIDVYAPSTSYGSIYDQSSNSDDGLSQFSLGSGIIISEDGYILTNNHVVSGAESISVVLNTGEKYDAKVVGADVTSDLAVVKITPDKTLAVADLGDSSALQVGELAVAIGNPMGQEFAGSVTAGVISALNRNVQEDSGSSLNVIQTDAAINPGNSGGPLVNEYGQVIGINTIKISSQGVEGMGFAIPINEAKPIISDLIAYGYVKGRPVIGISTRDISQSVAQSQGWPAGVQVMQVTPNSGADIAGLAQGDIITKADDQAVATSTDLNNIKDNHKPGDTIKLEVYKYSNGQTVTVSVKLQEQAPQPQTTPKPTQQPSQQQPSQQWPFWPFGG